MKKISLFIFALFVFFFVGASSRRLLGSLVDMYQLSSDQYISDLLATYSTSQEIVYNNTPIHTDLTQLYPFLAQIQADTDVLGDTSGRRIEVNLSQQRLYMWDGGTLLGNYLISSGLWAKTPTGNFNVWIKLAKTRMRGGSVALGTYYNLPNVPCTMYFYKGYGIHGTYWHNNFGHPMSHGCVNMRTSEACQVFNWSSVGTPVNIHY